MDTSSSTGSPAHQLVRYSEATVAKAVTSKVATQPLTVYPGVIAVVALTAATLFVSKIAFLLGLGGVVVGAGNMIVNCFFRHDVWSKRYWAEIREGERKFLLEYPDRLRGNLERLDESRGTLQIAKLKKSFDGVVTMLDKQLEPGELTYQRYFGMAQQVYWAALDRLDSVVRQLDSIASIDRSELIQRLEALRETPELEPEERALEARQGLVDGVLLEIENILVANEEAITTLTETARNIAKIETRVGQADMSLEEAVAALAVLAQNAGLYDRNNHEARKEVI